MCQHLALWDDEDAQMGPSATGQVGPRANKPLGLKATGHRASPHGRVMIYAQTAANSEPRTCIT